MRRTEAKFVVCVKNKNYAALLELRKFYHAISDEAVAKLRQIRVVDESGEGYLYPEEYFVAVQLPQSAEKQFGAPPQSEANNKQLFLPGSSSLRFLRALGVLCG